MWFTYRKDFPQVGDSDYTTDTGWGCMIRSAQMMLGTGLSYHLLGKGTFLTLVNFLMSLVVIYYILIM